MVLPFVLLIGGAVAAVEGLEGDAQPGADLTPCQAGVVGLSDRLGDERLSPVPELRREAGLFDRVRGGPQPLHQAIEPGHLSLVSHRRQAIAGRGLSVIVAGEQRELLAHVRAHAGSAWPGPDALLSVAVLVNPSGDDLQIEPEEVAPLDERD